MNSRLRELRKTHLLSQEELAEKVGVSALTVRRWEARQRPQPSHLRKLCEALEATPEELGFAVTRRNRQKPGPLVAAVDEERLADALLAPARTDRWLLDDLAAVTRGYAGQAQAVTPRMLLLEMTGHLSRLRILAAASHPPSTRHRLQMLLAEAAVMAGRLAFWSDNRGLAAGYFGEAEMLAREAGERQLEAVALAFRADLHSGVPYLGTMGGNTRMALALFDRAAALDAPDWQPVLRAWVVGCRAEERAALGQAAGSDRDMELAHRALASAGVRHNPVIDVASLDIVTSTAGLAGFIGACALALGRYEEAGAVFEQGLAEAVSVGRLSGLAAVRALQGEPEEACRLLIAALELALSRGLSTRMRRVEGVRARFLEPYADNPSVQEFDQRLAAAM